MPDWFTVNVRDTPWMTHETFGSACRFEDREAPFPQLAINLRVLQPGQPNCLYHQESPQEDFLVLAGECLLLVEGQEQRLRAWDFVHCPPETNHMIVGAGGGPAVVLAVGARGRGRSGIVYPVDPLALEHVVGVERETTKPQEAYAGLPGYTRCEYRPGWLPE